MLFVPTLSNTQITDQYCVPSLSGPCIPDMPCSVEALSSRRCLVGGAGCGACDSVFTQNQSPGRPGVPVAAPDGEMGAAFKWLGQYVGLKRVAPMLSWIT